MSAKQTRSQLARPTKHGAWIQHEIGDTRVPCNDMVSIQLAQSGQSLAWAEGITNPTEEELRRFDRGLKDKKVFTNANWESRVTRFN